LLALGGLQSIKNAGRIGGSKSTTDTGCARRLASKTARPSGQKLINEVSFMRIGSIVLIIAGLLSSSASAAPTACALISAADMSTVLGATVAAVADDRGGQTKCTYSAAGDELGGAYAEVQLNWGDGVAGMKGAGAMEPELGQVMGKLAGLGDQATSVGPMILIRRGSDLITLVISGVPDSDGAAKKIYGLLDAGLPKAAAP
jgi:hypothetical protein